MLELDKIEEDFERLVANPPRMGDRPDQFGMKMLEMNGIMLRLIQLMLRTLTRDKRTNG